MTIFLYVWLLFSQPYDRLVCASWVNAPLTADDLSAAGCAWSPEQAQGMIVRFYDVWTGQEVCARMATELPRVTCKLPLTLDNYILRVYQPLYRDQLCALTVDHPGEPTQEEIRQKCPPNALQQKYVAELAASGPYRAPEAPQPTCSMPTLTPDDLPLDPADLGTYQQYDLLAYHLRWWFGDDLRMYTWQNQWDRSIWQAGMDAKVPPRVLKALFARESQFWPLWSQAVDKEYGEVGLGRLTDEGADLVLRYAPDLYARFCPQAIARDGCAIGYDLLSPDGRQAVRNVFRTALLDTGWPDQAATAQPTKIPLWGRILAAYYCAAGEAVSGWGDRPAAERWQMTLAAYHSGPECIRDGTICSDGLKYLELP